MTMEDQAWFLNPSCCHHDVKGPVAPTTTDALKLIWDPIKLDGQQTLIRKVDDI